MSIDPLALDDLYRKYGFDPVPTSHAGIRAYALRTGYFLNADIVPINSEFESTSAKRELEDAGYACTVRPFGSISDAAEQLFRGFFAADSSRERLWQEYERFSTKISRTLGAPYEYIAGPYVADQARSDVPLDVVDFLLSLLAADGPTLVILEAAAGFGKTCTAYEVLNRLLLRDQGQVPLITELSLNRQAKIFRYVLLDEIDRNFPGLRSDLVREQIQHGRMPLIVDGFDELLYRGSALADQFEEVEPMLDTISTLLQDQAKVLLTTRRTAIFSDSEFERWLESRPVQFNVHRVRLDRPTLEDWLGPDRARLACGQGIPIRELSNPVLLAFLRYLEETEFERLCENPDQIVGKFFEAMLQREVQRQDLLMSVDDQLAVFRTLSLDMLREAFTTEPRDIIQLRIYDRNLELLERTRLEYRRDQRPSAEELATKLASHALLDRRGSDEQQVGFVNDFVLGSLVGDTIVREDVEVNDIADFELFIDLATTAYVAQSSESRDRLWTRLSDILDLFDPTRQFIIDVALKGGTQRPFLDAPLVGLRVESADVGGVYPLVNSVFIDCTFRRTSFSGASLRGITFLNCTFYECTVGQSAVVDNPIRLIACSGDEASIEQLERLAALTTEAPLNVTEQMRLERSVLENFWPRGRPNFSKSKQLRSLYRGHPKEDYEKIGQTIERLKKRGMIDMRSDHADLNLERLDDIREILGRNGE